MSEYSIEHCPHCGVDVCNGMGPATMPDVTAILNKTNTGKFFKRSCNIHDMDFHLQKGFNFSNKRFKSHMKADVKAAKFDGNWFVRFSKRTWLRSISVFIAWTVTGESGREAYDKGACKIFKVDLRVN
jgi:hypothetical protein